jgi:hypothetical protein
MSSTARPFENTYQTKLQQGDYKIIKLQKLIFEKFSSIHFYPFSI